MLKNKNITPLYRQISEKLRDQIISAVYKEGDILPSERKLAKENNVSVITSRKALSELEEDGLVTRVQGKGTFVTAKKYNRSLNKFVSFTEMCLAMGSKPGAKELEKKIIVPTSKIAEKLEVAKDSQVVYISRLRFVDDEPMVIEENYFYLDYAYLLNEDLTSSLFEIINKKGEFSIVDSRKTIETVRSDMEESSLLNIPVDSPIILIESIAYLKDNKIAYIGRQLINGERFKLVI